MARGGSATSRVRNYPSDIAPSAINLNVPSGVSCDNQGNVFVADAGNNRVLKYLPLMTTATMVIGQQNFSVGAANAGLSGPTALVLNNPSGVFAASALGEVFVADQLNHRVVVYDSSNGLPLRVYGQMGDFTTNVPSCSADGLSNPLDVAVGGSAGASGVVVVWIADAGNHRLTGYVGTSTTATRLIGQALFTSCGPNQGNGPTANALLFPQGVRLDALDNVYVADTNNNRVLFFLKDSGTASRVYGQSNFTTNQANSPNAASGLNGPQQVAVDLAAGSLWVADSSNSRVLRYPAGMVAPDAVYGQVDLQSTSAPAPSSTTLFFATGVCVDAGGNPVVNDEGNQRLVRYGNATSMVVSSELPPLVSGSVTIPCGGVATVSQAVTVIGDLRVDGALILGPAALLNVTGSVLVAALLNISATGHAPLVALGTLTIGAWASITALVNASPGPAAQVTYEVAQFSSLWGSFASNQTIAAFGGAECFSLSIQSFDASPTALSLTVGVTHTCTDQGLSQGAIIGISVACAVVGLALACGLVAFFAYRQRRRGEVLKQVLHTRDIELAKVK